MKLLIPHLVQTTTHPQCRSLPCELACQSDISTCDQLASSFPVPIYQHTTLNILSQDKLSAFCAKQVYIDLFNRVLSNTLYFT